MVPVAIREGSRTGSGRSSRASAKLNIADVAPIPMASEHTLTSVKPGVLDHNRTAKRNEFSIERASLWCDTGLTSLRRRKFIRTEEEPRIYTGRERTYTRSKLRYTADRLSLTFRAITSAGDNRSARSRRSDRQYGCQREHARLHPEHYQQLPDCIQWRRQRPRPDQLLAGADRGDVIRQHVRRLWSHQGGRYYGRRRLC